jgi:hypothetical protein
MLTAEEQTAPLFIDSGKQLGPDNRDSSLKRRSKQLCLLKEDWIAAEI